MSGFSLQGLSGYQMMLQSYSSQISELTSKGDSSSLAMASSLRQQFSSIRSQLTVAQSNNDSNLNKRNKNEKDFAQYIYDENAKKQQITAASFDATV